MLLGESAEPRYAVRWEASRYGELTVAQFDQSQDEGPFIHPAYRGRLSLVSHGPESLLHFDPVQEQDFGEYLCKGHVVGQEGETFTSLSVLAEDTQPELEAATTSDSANRTLTSLSSSGRVRARLGASAQLECRMEAGDGDRYAVQWETAGGGVVVSRVDQGEPAANYLNPRYGQQLSVSLLDGTTRLSFHSVRQDDFGEYACNVWLSGHPEHTVTAYTTLEEEPLSVSPVVETEAPLVPSSRAPQHQTPGARIVALTTSGKVTARLGSPATLSCRVMVVNAEPETRYRLAWSSQRHPNLTLAQIDQGRGNAAWVHPSYRDRLSLTANGGSSRLHFGTVTDEDPGEYVCKAGISGSGTDDLTSPVLLLKAKPRILPASSETAILWLILHFFVILFAMTIGIGSCFLSGTKNRILPEHV
ncbi:uncharacterized protein LOC125450397 isoform X2 [Stegostoma tigrinum]|nr:uncharacterized protein LOC125450397 isoform X2 [Stegostoma tigrinum]